MVSLWVYVGSDAVQSLSESPVVCEYYGVLAFKVIENLQAFSVAAPVAQKDRARWVETVRIRPDKPSSLPPTYGEVAGSSPAGSLSLFLSVHFITLKAAL